MTNAAKLLPCPFMEDGYKHILRVTAVISDEFRVRCTCGAQGPIGSTEAEASKRWNTRPQPAPPEGEPDFEERRAMFIDFCALHKFGMNGWPRACLDQFNTIMRQMYRLGLAARPKVEDKEVAELVKRMRSKKMVEVDLFQTVADLLERLAGELDLEKSDDLSPIPALRRP